MANFGIGCVGKYKSDNTNALNPAHIALCESGRYDWGDKDAKSLQDCVCKGEGASRDTKISGYLD